MPKLRLLLVACSMTPHNVCAAGQLASTAHAAAGDLQYMRCDMFVILHSTSAACWWQ